MKDLLEGIKVKEECNCYFRARQNVIDGKIGCPRCNNNGKITRPATWEDLPPWARIVEGLMIISDEGFLDIMDKDEVLKDHIRIAKSLLKTKTGRLRVE